MPSPGRVPQVVWRRPTGLQLFASTHDEPWTRRPTDIALAVFSAIVIVVTATLSKFSAELEESVSDVLTSFPALFDPVWSLGLWSPLAWSVALLVISVVRRRLPLALDLVAAGALSLVLAATLAVIVMADDVRSVIALLVDVDGPPVFPPGALTLSTAVISTASPHLSRPFRHFGRWLIASQFVALLFLGAAVGAGSTAAIALGTFSAAVIHLAVGSPGGRPTVSRIRLALGDLGITANQLAPASMRHAGVVWFEGHDRDGPLLVKSYGRDALDAQMLANLWRLAWYRNSAPTARPSRIGLVEHEGFVTVLAERAGIRVPHLVTAGSTGRGDALVVVRPNGIALSVRTGAIDDAMIAALWAQVERLHDAGITHRMIDLDRVVVAPDGSPGFGDLSSASVTDEPADLQKDRAQVVALSILLAGEDRALAAARDAVGDTGVIDLLPYLQEAAMPPLVRDALGEQDVELDDVRGRLAASLGATPQPLIKLRRVTRGSLLNLALLALAAYTLIGLFSDVDLESFADALQDASWWWLAFALLLAQIPRIPAAVSTMGSTAQTLPLGPLTTLQFAICYVNLAIPSTAARIAINIRFFQRFGVPPAAAISAGAIDSVSGFVVQIALFLALFFSSDLNLELSTDTGELSGVATIALIVIAAIVVLAVIVAAVPALRQRVIDASHQAREALGVLRSPTKLLQLFGGNVVSQVLFGVAFGACVQAFGTQLSLGELVLINTVVSLFAGLLPIPGGIGVSEAGLTLGLTTAGLPAEIAFACALAYRFTSFYLPPIWGWFCYRWLVRKRYL